MLFGHADRMEVIDPDRYVRMFVNRSKRLSMPKKNQADVEEENENAVTFDADELRIIQKFLRVKKGSEIC